MSLRMEDYPSPIHHAMAILGPDHPVTKIIPLLTALFADHATGGMKPPAPPPPSKAKALPDRLDTHLAAMSGMVGQDPKNPRPDSSRTSLAVHLAALRKKGAIDDRDEDIRG